ncbi:MAG: solute carrier 26 family protein [Calditrichaeota bacterium]|nr:MAG: solute carrier 26 family protein [Calditrichota bacterium]
MPQFPPLVKTLRKAFPILEWLPNYRRQDLGSDLAAGITIGAMQIPQGMAYAMLAGLAPITGLYAALVGLVVYPILGTSRQLSVGPTAMDSLLVASALGALGAMSQNTYATLAALLAMMIGALQLTMGLLRLGFLVNFLSQPVISGFASAAAFIIGFSQLKYLFRVDIHNSQQIHKVLIQLWAHLGEVHWPTLAVGGGFLLFMILLRYWKPGWPSALLVVVFSVVLVRLFHLEKTGLRIVGNMPHGLPHFQLPQVSLQQIEALIPGAFTIALVSFMESIAIAKKFAETEGYTVRHNQELIALGLSDLTAGAFGGYHVGGSPSRTAANVFAGARTQLASLITALTIALTLLFFTPLFYYLPQAALAAIVIMAVTGLVDLREPLRLWRIRKEDFAVLAFTFFSTLALGVIRGLLLGIAISLVIIIRRISYPEFAILGRIPGTNVLRNIKRAPEAREIEGLLVFRVFASLYFANVQYVKDQLQQALARRKGKVKFVLFDASSINEIDAQAVRALEEMVEELAHRGVSFYMSNVRGPVRDVLQRAGFYQKLGEDHFFYSKEEAVEVLERRLRAQVASAEMPGQRS